VEGRLNGDAKRSGQRQEDVRLLPQPRVDFLALPSIRAAPIDSDRRPGPSSLVSTPVEHHLDLLRVDEVLAKVLVQAGVVP
jgi:hypothetical protein